MKKGFTLIELLAVIIVLAIIILIATPIIFNVIENAKLKSLENSCYGIIDAVKTNYFENLLNSEDGKVNLSGDVDDLIISGEQPYYGTWEIDNTKDSNKRGIKIKNVKFKSMKNYTCNNDLTTGKVNCIKDEIDNTIPTITPKQSTISVGKGTNKKIKKYFDVTFGTTGGEVVCDIVNVNSLEIGNHTIKCIATGTNGKTAESSITLTVAEFLKDVILKETIKGTNVNWTTSWQESGLYAQSVKKNKTYYFRGQPTNNYIKFAGLDFRIIRINEDGSIRIILANSFKNRMFNSNTHSYDKIYYTNSGLKSEIDNWFTTNITGEYVNKVVTNGTFCETARTMSDDSYVAGNVNLIRKENYTPTFNCTIDENNKGIVTASAGLITYDEVIFAGGWYSKTINYYLNDGTDYWTMSPAGLDINNYAHAWYISSNGYINNNIVFNSYGLRPVINLKADTLVIGSGTSTNPYIVK